MSIQTGLVSQILEDGVLVKVGAKTFVLELHELRGGTYSLRKERLKELKLNDPIEVDVSSGFASERRIQDGRLMDSLTVGTSDTVGTIVESVILDVRKNFLLVRILEGVARGYQAIVYVDHVPHHVSGRFSFIASRKVGDKLRGEVIYARRPEDLRMDVSLGLSLIGAAARQGPLN